MKTAVEWLIEELTYDNGNGVRLPSFNEFADVTDICEQAKEMERQQIIDFGQEIVNDIAYDSQDKEWVADKYKETFKSE